MGSTELGFFEDDCRRTGFTSPARPRGDGGATRETDSILSTLRAPRAEHGSRARARLATDGSPVDSPSAEAGGAEICLASPSRKRPAGRQKHNYTLLYNAPVRGVGCFPRGDASFHATGKNYQSPSSGTRSMRVIPKVRNI